MRKVVFFIFIGLIIIVAGLYLTEQQQDYQLLSPLGVDFNSFKSLPSPTPKPRIYDQYSFDNISKKEFPKGQIKLEKILKKDKGFVSWLFSYDYNGKKISGMLNLPDEAAGLINSKKEIVKTDKKWPVVVMMRGYVDDNIFYTGIGTQPAASKFAQNGFITFAPDFLGFGDSDQAAIDILEARFQCPEEVLSLLSSLETFPLIDTAKMFFWAHSNGGQIALSVLEITGRQIPTTLWAPVSRGFPEAVLQYMDLDNLDEGGLKVKKAIDDFLVDYSPGDFSVDYHWDEVKAPLQVHQGLSDDMIPIEWTDSFVSSVKKTNKQVNYYKYRYSNHQLAYDWDTVVDRDLNFFRKFL